MAKCEKCAGDGVVPHVKRSIGTNDYGVLIDDPDDKQLHDLCSPCGGSGAVPDKPPRQPIDHSKGFLADQIAVSGFWAVPASIKPFVVGSIITVVIGAGGGGGSGGGGQSK